MKHNKLNLGAVPADAEGRRSVNINEHLVKGTCLLTKFPHRVGQPRTLVFGVFATLFVAIASILLLYGCQKDREELSDAKKKKTATTQIVDIQIVVNVDGFECEVVGTALVNNHNGTIYNVNVGWTIPITGADAYTCALIATLKPEFDGVTDYIAPVMTNYNIVVTPADALTDEMLTSVWTSIVAECEANATTAVYPFVLPEAMRPYQYAVQKADVLLALEYMQTVFENYIDGEERGYFTMCFSASSGLVCYGFIDETSSLYQIDDFVYPNYYIDPFIYPEEDDGDGGMCYARIKTTNETKMVKWIDRQLARGRDITQLDYNSETGVWTGTSKKPDNWKDPFQK